MIKWSLIDWSNPDSKISRYFTVRDALWLREWKRMGVLDDGLNDVVKCNIVLMADKLDLVQDFLEKKILIKSWWRPLGYNAAIGGARNSTHMALEEASGVDWWTDKNGDGHLTGEDCFETKASLMFKLEEYGIRMENNFDDARWVHTDDKIVPPGGRRFFKP